MLHNIFGASAGSTAESKPDDLKGVVQPQRAAGVRVSDFRQQLAEDTLLASRVGAEELKRLQMQSTTNFSGLMSITIRFSRLIGDILREIPLDEEPPPKYKYYR